MYMKVNPEISAIAVIVFSTAMAQTNYKRNTSGNSGR